MNNADFELVSSGFWWCLQWYADSSYDKIVSLLWEPNRHWDDYKVSTEWWVIHIPTWILFSIYDYKMTDMYYEEYDSVNEFRSWPSYDWHIWWNDNVKSILPEIQEFLSTNN